MGDFEADVLSSRRHWKIRTMVDYDGLMLCEITTPIGWGNTGVHALERHWQALRDRARYAIRRDRDAPKEDPLRIEVTESASMGNNVMYRVVFKEKTTMTNPDKPRVLREADNIASALVGGDPRYQFNFGSTEAYVSYRRHGQNSTASARALYPRLDLRKPVPSQFVADQLEKLSEVFRLQSKRSYYTDDAKSYSLEAHTNLAAHIEEAR